jgi:hypothetical protein
MRLRAVFVALLALLAAPVLAQEAGNGLISVKAVGEAGHYTGFAVSADGREVTTVALSSNGALVATKAEATEGKLRFSGLRFDPTPGLGGDSYVEVELLPKSPYPEVRFSLEMESFDKEAWEARHGKVPVHFLTCSVPGAQVFEQRGWAIGTPAVDDYIQMKAEGPGRTIVSSWSRDWMYAPPIGAYPTAACGLWNSTTGLFVGYDFHGARLTDHTEKDFGTTYCWRNGSDREFFCLTWPYGEGYINLRYPTTPVTCGTHFRLLWFEGLGPEKDPNELVHRFIWREYADLLPGSERMSDLSWLPGDLRPSGIGTPGPLGPFVSNAGPTGSTWWQPNVNIAGGVGYFSPVDYYYAAGDRASTARLGSECRKLVTLGQWADVEGDRCFRWQTPLDGGGAAMFGPGVETVRDVNNWSSGLALLDYYRNDPQGAADLLPYIDGVLRWTKHTLYTRNCYPDVPAAQFAWSATPAVTFCLKYHYRFRDDPERKDLADLAYTLARSMTYRYMALWPCDNDEMDNLDSSFMMEPNAGLPWLGSACANEVWVYNIAMLYEAVACGDRVMAHYLRGMLERYHEMYQNQWYATVNQYPSGAFTERLGLFDECAQGKGVRGDFGGLWGGLERLIWPLGKARVHVVCGERGAMAFCRDGRHTDIADYRYYEKGDCSFTLVPAEKPADPEALFDATVSFPFFAIADKRFSVIRAGQTTQLDAARVERYPGDSSAVTLKDLKLGDVICVGRYDPTAPVTDLVPIKPRKMPSGDVDFIASGSYHMLNLTRGATGGIDRDWSNAKSMAGYEPGVKTLWGVPFLLLDPELTGGPVEVPGEGIAYGERPEYLFLLVGGIDERSSVTLHRSETVEDPVDLSGALPALRGWPPLFAWHLDLVAVRNDGRPIMSVAPRNCQVFAVTSTDARPDELKPTLTALKAERDKVLAHRAMVAELGKLGPLFAEFSGHIAILPTPSVKNPRGTALVQMLQEADLAQHVRIMRPADLVDPTVFNTRNVWIAFYLGGEDYYQTVNRQGDGDEAMVRWLTGGGTLVSLASGPFPFYYNEANKPVVSAPKFGLPIAGSGAESREDVLKVSATVGWEKPPGGLGLRFKRAAEQKVITDVPDEIPWADVTEPRWRPMLNVVPKGNDYTPIIGLRDQEGKDYGDAAAMVRYRVGGLAGARALYVWNGLYQSAKYQRAILTDVLRYLLTDPYRPLAETTAVRTASPPVIDGKLDDPVWRDAPATTPFIRVDLNRASGPARHTTAKLLWDDEALYIAWDCEDPDVSATLTERDADLWTEEVVEAFIDPDGDGLNYYEIEVNPLNTVVDLCIPRAENGGAVAIDEARKWNATGLRTAVNVAGTVADSSDRDTGWSCEVAVPWANFGKAAHLPPRVGDTWRVQLPRIERKPEEQLLAWSPTDAFHRPERFGTVTFAANAADDDFSAYAEGAPPTPTWTPSAGEWTVTGGALVGRDCPADGWTPVGATGGSPEWTDYKLSLRFRITERGSDHRDGAWVGFRYTGADSCYSVALTGGVVTLHKAYAGASSGDDNALAKVPWATDNAWHALAVTVRGAEIAVALDGREIIRVTDGNALGVAPVPAGGVCLCARRWANSTGHTVVAFDDVNVGAIGPSP